MGGILGFPNPVDEVSARLVAAGVGLLCAAILVLELPVLLVVLAYGFVARVLTGPKLSPLAQLVTRVLTPRLPLPPRYVPGPPKRFAQGIGAALSLGAVLSHYGLGAPGLADVLVAMILAAASLEAVFALCLGCKIFAVLMRVDLIPEATCRECVELWGRLPPAEPGAGRLSASRPRWSESSCRAEQQDPPHLRH